MIDKNIVKLSDNWWFNYMLYDDGSQGLCFKAQNDTIYVKELEYGEEDKFFARMTFGDLKDEAHDIFVTKEFHKELMQSLKAEEKRLKELDFGETFERFRPYYISDEEVEHWKEEKKKQNEDKIKLIEEELKHYERNDR